MQQVSVCALALSQDFASCPQPHRDRNVTKQAECEKQHVGESHVVLYKAMFVCFPV